MYPLLNGHKHIYLPYTAQLSSTLSSQPSGQRSSQVTCEPSGQRYWTAQ